MQKQGTAMNNKLNAMMDHCWDGFYTCQIRKSRFPAIVDAEPGSVYDIMFTGTPPKNMKFELRSDAKQSGMTIRIHYPSAESRNIVKNGKLINYNPWDDAIPGYGPIKQSRCGENRYIGVKNILEFFITPDCFLEIKPRDAIQCAVRLEWSITEFFAAGGSTTFADRLAASIGIVASQIKIVSVYEGSLIVDYELIPSPSAPDPAKDLAQIQAK